MRRNGWLHGEWAGLIALVLAIGVSISMVVSIVGATLSTGGLSTEKSNLLSTVVGASVGVIGTYIGAHGRGGRRSEDDRRTERREE
jgi:uncharacterized membrane protein